MSVPAEPQLLVTVETVAGYLGMDATALTEVQQQTIEDAILDAQGDVAEYLNRPLFPTRVVLPGVSPSSGYYPVTDWRAWLHVTREYEDDITVVTAVLEADGTYTLTFDVGIDASTIRAIVRYVREAAIESARQRTEVLGERRRVRTYSAEGQSVTFDAASTQPATPGAAPTLQSLDGWVRHSVGGQVPAAPAAPWPFASSPVGWDPR